MPFEYEALVGHLYVVGGRAVKMTPPGALVEIAPHKAARGREADTFFTLVMPSGQSSAPAQFYEQLANLAAERYFNSTGSVTSGLRDVFTTLNHNLYEHNSKPESKSYEANLLCAVLRGSDLIVGRVGPSVVVLNHQGETRTFPEDLTHDESLYTAPMGVHPIPNVRMTQYRVSDGSRLVLGDSNIADVDREHIRAALMARDLAMTVVTFKELARLQMTLMAVQFVSPDAPETVSLPAGQSTKEVEVALREAKKSTPASTTATGQKPSREKRKRNKSGEKLQQQARQGLSRSALGLAGMFNLLKRIINRFFPPPKEDDRNIIRSPITAASVILVPIGVVMLVIVLWLSGTGESSFEICVEESVSIAQTARSIPASEVQTATSLWNELLNQVNVCNQQRPGDPTIDALRTEAQQFIDLTSQIDRREVVPIETFTAATLTRIISQGQDLYVLDSANGIVYRAQLTSDGLTTVNRGTPIMQRGRNYDGRILEDIIDIAFSDTAGRIMALDINGTLVSCSPMFLDCTSQQLLDADVWLNAQAFTLWNDSLYVLDAGTPSGQVWRYEPTGNLYPDPPTERVRESFSGGVDLAIDENGSIYILLADGTVNKYRSDEREPFEYRGFPVGQGIDSAVAMYLDSRPTSQTLFFVNQNQRTIYETGRTGGFRNTYRTFTEDNWALIADVTSTNSTPLLYVVSGNTIFAFSPN